MKSTSLLLSVLGPGTVIAVIFLNGRTLELTILLASMACIAWAVEPTKERFALAVYMWIVGAVVEVLAVHTHAWQYPLPTFLGIPAWVPFMWSIGSLTIVKIKKSIDVYFKKRA